MQEAARYRRADDGLHCGLAGQINLRRAPRHRVVDGCQILAGTKLVARRTEQRDAVAAVPEGCRAMAAYVVEQAEHPDDRGGIDGLIFRLVIQAHVAADDRGAQGFAGLGHALDDLLQLVVDVRFFGIAEVEAVRDRQWSSAGAGDVACCFDHGGPATPQRIEVAIAAVAVGADG